MKLWIILLLMAMLGVCTLSYCGTKNEAQVPPLHPTGLNALGGCGASGCHASSVLGVYPPTSGSHTSRSSTASLPRGHVYMMDCEQCHYQYETKPTHRDGTLTQSEIVFLRPDAFTGNAVYNETSGSCSGSGCHAPHAWGTTTSKFNTVNTKCKDCHGSPYSFAPAPLSGRHSWHMDVQFPNAVTCGVDANLGGQNLSSCNACHYQYINNANHKNGVSNSGSSIIKFHPIPGNAGGCTTGPADATYFGPNTLSCGSGCHLPRVWNF